MGTQTKTILAHKSGTTAIINYGTTTRHAGAELLKHIGVVQMEASSAVARPPHVRLVLMQQMQHLQSIHTYGGGSVMLRTARSTKAT